MEGHPKRQPVAKQQQQHRADPLEPAMGKPEAVRVGLLGGFRVSVGSRVVGEGRWRLKKARSLVKLLALSRGHRLHREQAIEALWPDLDPEAAANNLYYALHVARRALQPAARPANGDRDTACSRYLLLRDEQLLLCPDSPLWVDVEAFEEAAITARNSREPAAYRAAMDLYGGELLPEDRYEGWAEERRSQLKVLYLSLLVELAALHEERKEYEPAIEALGRVVGEEPVREEAHAGLMRLYGLFGRRREALAQYEHLRQILSREYGTEPDAEVTRLQREIWAGTFPNPHSPVSAGFPADEADRSAVGRTPAKASGKHNLPLPRTSFVGREGEMLEIKRLLAMTNLLTLTGTGGCGKTRLALEVARDLVEVYPDGVWLVELAPLSDPTLVAQAVAQALGVREQPGRPLLETLGDVLRKKKTLLVIDNCEHLVEAVAETVDSLLASCPDLRVLATGRERLNTAGEVVHSVRPLTVPGSHSQEYAPGRLEAYESVRLFVQRARRRDPSFALVHRNARAVGEACRVLEGIPLAVELAAARMGMLSADQLSERLEDSLRVLSRGERTADPRHQSLRATLEWSYELLGARERALFGRLSVFSGGWTLEASEEVCSGDGLEREGVLDVLSELVDKSLVVAETSPVEGGAPRFRMLEPIRQYAHERLEESGAAEHLRERHARYFLKLAEDADTEGEDAQEADSTARAARPLAWFKKVETEHANLRAALSWSLDQDAEEPEDGVNPDDARAELGLRLAAALYWFWYTHDYSTEGRSYLEKARAGGRGTTPARLRARALNGAAGIATPQGDYVAAKSLLEEGLALYRELGDEEGIASALTDLGLVAVWGQREDIPLAAVMEELRELEPRVVNRRTLAWLLVLEALVALSRGDLEYSVTLHERGLEIFREMRDWAGTTTCLGQLGGIVLLQGDYERASSLMRETLRLGWEARHILVLQFSSYALGLVAAARNQPLRAARLWGTVEGIGEDYGVHIQPISLSQGDYEGRLNAARSQLDEETWERAWAEGKAMPLEQAVEYALSEEEEEREPYPPVVVSEQHPPPHSDDESTERLSAREEEVVILVARGLTNRQVADELSISERTVANHVGRILKKLGLPSRVRVAAWAAERGLLERRVNR